MDKTIKKLSWYVFITMILVALIGGLLLFKKAPQSNLGMTFASYASDVIGTKTGTTTAAVGFGITTEASRTATTSYITKIGQSNSEATYMAKVKQASTTAVMV